LFGRRLNCFAYSTAHGHFSISTGRTSTTQAKLVTEPILKLRVTAESNVPNKS
jgi:hypothetical protein